jgi:hypothetical protein
MYNITMKVRMPMPGEYKQVTGKHHTTGANEIVDSSHKGKERTGLYRCETLVDKDK